MQLNFDYKRKRKLTKIINKNFKIMKLFLLGAGLALGQECSDVGDFQVECDPDCALASGLGCEVSYKIQIL